MGCMSSRISPDSENKPKEDKQGLLLRGDVATKYESRSERERKMKEKQLRITSAAEELSGRILEEKERLSLNSKSRETSVSTSRVASPSVEKKKHVQFRKEEKLREVNNDHSEVNGSVASASGVHPFLSAQPGPREAILAEDKPSKSKSPLKNSKSG